MFYIDTSYNIGFSIQNYIITFCFLQQLIINLVNKTQLIQKLSYIESMKDKSINHSGIYSLNQISTTNSNQMNNNHLQQHLNAHKHQQITIPSLSDSLNGLTSFQNNIIKSPLWIKHPQDSTRSNFYNINSEYQLKVQPIKYPNNWICTIDSDSQNNICQYCTEQEQAQAKDSYFIPQNNNSLKWLNKKICFQDTCLQHLDIKELYVIDLEKSHGYIQKNPEQMLDNAKKYNCDISESESNDQNIQQPILMQINNSQQVNTSFHINQCIYAQSSVDVMDVQEYDLQNTQSSNNQLPKIRQKQTEVSQEFKKQQINRLLYRFKLQAKDFESGIKIVDIRRKLGREQRQYQWILINKKYWKSLGDALQQNFDIYIRQNERYRSIFKHLIDKNGISIQKKIEKIQSTKIQRHNKDYRLKSKTPYKRQELKQIFNYVLMTKFIQFEINMCRYGIQETRANLKQDSLSQYIPNQQEYFELFQDIVEKNDSSTQQLQHNTVDIFWQRNNKNKNVPLDRQLLNKFQIIEKGFNLPSQVNQIFSLNKRFPSLACLCGGLGLRSTQTAQQICRDAYYQSMQFNKRSKQHRQYISID